MTRNRVAIRFFNNEFQTWDEIKFDSTGHYGLIVAAKEKDGQLSCLIVRVPKNKALRFLQLWYYKIKDFYLVP